MTTLLRHCTFIAALVAAAPAAVRAQDPVRLTLSYSAMDEFGLAVMPVQGANGDSIQAIVQRDLRYSDRFNIVDLDPGAATTFRVANGNLNYPVFAALRVKAVVELKPTATGLHVTIHDVGGANVSAGGVRDFTIPTTPAREWRMGLHRASDWIQQVITGVPGIAATRIAFARPDPNDGTIRLIDSDGWGMLTIPTEENALSPAWHPSGSRIAYSTYGASSRIVTVDLATGARQVIVPARVNLSVGAPVFTPDGESILYHVAGETGGGEIWRATAPNWSAARITATGSRVFSGLPTVSPRGDRIAFTTDRFGGHNEVYVSNIDGSDARLLQVWKDISQKNDRTEADWSPDGNKIAFSSISGGRGIYQIYIFDLVEQSLKQVTSAGINEQPSWAPDSRHLVFTSDRTGSRQLHVMDVEKNTTRQLTFSAGSKLPAWSPRLP